MKFWSYSTLHNSCRYGAVQCCYLGTPVDIFVFMNLWNLGNFINFALSWIFFLFYSKNLARTLTRLRYCSHEHGDWIFNCVSLMQYYFLLLDYYIYILNNDNLVQNKFIAQHKHDSIIDRCASMRYGFKNKKLRFAPGMLWGGHLVFLI